MRCSIIYLICVVFLVACNDVTVGYLETENAEYIPDNMEIPQIEDLDEVVDALRIKNNAPWVTQPIQGKEGTDPMIYSIEEVTATEGGDAMVFKQELRIIGNGSFYYPLEHKAPAGKYVVSIRITNEGYSHVVKDIYTFVVK